MSDPLILAFDTSAAHCAAALLRGTDIVTLQSEAMSRGQAERLMPMLDQMLAQSGLCWGDLTRIGVGVGPGNFTGLRIGVSAARGLALALDIPVIGVSTFQAVSLGESTAHIAAVAGPRDQIYIQNAGGEQSLLPLAEAGALGLRLSYPPEPAELACRIARIAATSRPGAAPAPLYLRAADAAPARAAPPIILPDDVA